MAAPTVRAVGVKATGAVAITPAAPASHVSGDVEYLHVESDNGATCTLSTAAGFAAVTSGQAILAGTPPSSTTTTCTTFWRRWNGTDGNPTVADTGNHTSGYIVTIQDAIASGDPHEAVTTSTQAATTAGSATGGTTSVADTLVLIFATATLPDATADPSANLSAWANAALASITEQKEYTVIDGNGGLAALTSGTKATAGAIGSTTYTSVTSAGKAHVVLAVLPIASAAAAVPWRDRTYPQIIPQ